MYSKKNEPKKQTLQFVIFMKPRYSLQDQSIIEMNIKHRQYKTHALTYIYNKYRNFIEKNC